jgi:hypothetical protein
MILKECTGSGEKRSGLFSGFMKGKVASNFAGRFLAVRRWALARSRERPSPLRLFMYKVIRIKGWGILALALALTSAYLHCSCSIQVYARLITFGPNKPFGRPSNELAGDSPFVAIIAFFSMDWRIGFVVGR